ncbi:hypothetical protein M758_1G327600 [Ceratodon purpureus]|uniref:Secreted protein n=1 Tax=Ceratodon purpureus TaxID=3225 RepID=A0A8T0JF40_CERPU|nr:hypothetical protein KC19_1G335200 [Ceratodon purpureus]KAG0632425.1 hypothetical protein M758_1G327600 [Ceratodon purpureus]
MIAFRCIAVYLGAFIVNLAFNGMTNPTCSGVFTVEPLNGNPDYESQNQRSEKFAPARMESHTQSTTLTSSLSAS